MFISLVFRMVRTEMVYDTHTDDLRCLLVDIYSYKFVPVFEVLDSPLLNCLYAHSAT